MEQNLILANDKLPVSYICHVVNGVYKLFAGRHSFGGQSGILWILVHVHVYSAGALLLWHTADSPGNTDFMLTYNNRVVVLRPCLKSMYF